MLFVYSAISFDEDTITRINDYDTLQSVLLSGHL
jgi:hypothetical protein